jgi:hypothetical protein
MTKSSVIGTCHFDINFEELLTNRQMEAEMTLTQKDCKIGSLLLNYAWEVLI